MLVKWLEPICVLASCTGTGGREGSQEDINTLTLPVDLTKPLTLPTRWPYQRERCSLHKSDVFIQAVFQVAGKGG